MLTILVPAYNEADSIVEVLRRCLRVPTEALGVTKEIVVCDDGSTDATAALVEREARLDPRITLVRHGVNQGKSAALRTALAHASGEHCVIQDADLEYEPSDYLPMLEAVARGAVVVYGSRFLGARRPAGMRLANWIANRLLTFTARLLFGIRITDEATCLKLFPTALLRRLGIASRGFDFCPEITAKVALSGVPITEVPIRYRARSVADGKKIRWTDAVRAMWVLVSSAASKPFQRRAKVLDRPGAIQEGRAPQVLR
jgi:glycosyltransferase involved in cell wall biosynthesis